MLSLKTKILAVGGAAAALLFFGTSKASAADNGGGGGGPAPGPVPAPQGQKARVTEPTGMVVRTEPSTRGGNATRTGTVLPQGSVVTVLQSGIPDADGATGGTWIRIAASNGVVGYSRFTDPQGVSNFQLI